MSIQDYLKEIDKYPLLEENEEKDLFTKLKKLEKDLFEVKEKEERKAIAKEVSNIKNRIIKCNLRLVLSIAKKINVTSNLADIIELIDEGSLGLMEAIDKFEVERGNKFSTYAYWWVRQRIKTVIIANQSQLKASVNLYNLAYRIKSYLSMNAKDYFDYEEVAEFLNISVENVKTAAPLLSRLVYLDEPIGAEGDEKLTVGDTIASPFDVIEEKEFEWLREFINEFLENNIFPALKEREVYVLKNRFGLNESRQSLSLKDVGENLSLTSERVRQLEQGSLKKIRKMNGINVLKELLPYG